MATARKPLTDAQREARNAKARERYAAKRLAEGKPYAPRIASEARPQVSAPVPAPAPVAPVDAAQPARKPVPAPVAKAPAPPVRSTRVAGDGKTIVRVGHSAPVRAARSTIVLPTPKAATCRVEASRQAHRGNVRPGAAPARSRYDGRPLATWMNPAEARTWLHG